MPGAARSVEFFKVWLFSIVAALAFLAPERTFAGDPFPHRLFERIVVFGASLSDPGNAFALLGGETVGPPDYGMAGVDPVTGIPDVIPLVPAAPYKTEHFSNSRRTWIEMLADAVGLGRSVEPAFAGSDGRASNYAIGGATAADLTAVGGAPTHLGIQVNAFLADVLNNAPTTALYVMEFGGNDIRFAMLAANPLDVIDASVDSVEQNIRDLHAAGARKFFVWNVPDLGSTPSLQRLDGVAVGIAALASFLSEVYNATLIPRLQQLEVELQDLDIVVFDVFTHLKDIQQHPRRFGLNDASTACIQPNVPQFGFPSSPPFRCKNPQKSFFWDGIHPTRAGHRIIALVAARTLLTELVLDD